MREKCISVGLALGTVGLLWAILLSSTTTRQPREVPPAVAVPAPPAIAARPPIPIGTATALGNGWTLTVLEIATDAEIAVLAASNFNAPPSPGAQFVMVHVAAAYHGAAPCVCDAFTAPSPFTLRALGASGQVYTTFRQETSCGLEIPGGLPPVLSDAGPPDSSISGNVCWQVRTADAAGLLLFYKPLHPVEPPGPLFFAIYPDVSDSPRGGRARDGFALLER